MLCSELYDYWSLPKEVLHQVTIRLPVDTFYKIQAIELMFPHRSMNELISDLLQASLSELDSDS